MEDELAPEFDDNPGSTEGTKFSVLHSWSDVVFDRWPTHEYIRVLLRVFSSGGTAGRVIEYLHRHEEAKTVNEDLCFLACCTSPLAVTTVVGFLDLRRVSISSELKPFCSACALMLQSQPRILVPLEFLKWRCPGFNRRVKRSFIRMFELLLCGRVFLGARFRLVSSPQTWGAHGLRS